MVATTLKDRSQLTAIKRRCSLFVFRHSKKQKQRMGLAIGLSMLIFNE